MQLLKQPPSTAILTPKTNKTYLSYSTEVMLCFIIVSDR